MNQRSFDITVKCTLTRPMRYCGNLPAGSPWKRYDVTTLGRDFQRRRCTMVHVILLG